MNDDPVESQEQGKERISVSSEDDRIIQELLAAPSMWAEPDPSLEDRVVAAVTTQAARGRIQTPPRSVPRRATRRPARRPVAIIGATAAAAAVIVAVAFTANSVRGTSTPHLTAALAPSVSGSGVSATADLTRTAAGWRVDLHTRGLPRLDNGRFYEAWMKNDAGVLVAIGTFNQGPNVTLWSGVSPDEFSTITITAQQANGDARSSGVRVLAGTIKP